MPTWDQRYYKPQSQELAMLLNGCDEGGTAIPPRVVSGTVSVSAGRTSRALPVG